MKFKKGDRVACYGYEAIHIDPFNGEKGVIRGLWSCFASVEMDDDLLGCIEIHVKQLSKLKKKGKGKK